MYWGLIRCHLQFDHYVSRQPNVIEGKATTYAHKFTHIFWISKVFVATPTYFIGEDDCELLHIAWAYHNSRRSVLESLPTILQKAPTFSKLSPTFLEKTPTFFEKATMFFEKAPSFSRQSATFEGNLKTYPQGIRWAFGGFYTIGTKPKDQAQGKCHKLLPQPEVGSLPRWAFSRQHSGDCSPHFNPCTTVYSSPYTTF